MSHESQTEGVGWQEWLALQRTGSTMTSQLVSLGSVGGWGMSEERFGRPDGKFFRLVGLRIRTADREVREWDQPIIQEVGEGAVVLFRARGEERYLLAARAEPGNARPGCVLLGPPLQASFSNLQQAHGGTRPPRAELLDGVQMPWLRLHQDGGRFHHKTNAYAVVEVDPQALEPLRPNERWFSRTELREALLDGELNEHLVQAVVIAMLA